MNILVIGAGYVGLVQGACLAELGHNVGLVDINKERVAALKKGQVPFFELIAGAQRIVIVVTFVAVLELMKELKVMVKQVDLDGEIWVYQREPSEEVPEVEEGSQSEATEDV